MHKFIRRSAVITALVMAASSPAHAQQAGPGPRWLGLLGCWSIAQSGSAQDSQRDGRIVCITPTPDANVAEISAIADGKVVTRDRVDASGRTYPLQVTGCVGSQHANWSADERRVYLKSVVTCNGVTTEMSALLALTLTGNWIDVRRVWAGHPDSAEVRVARYRDIGLPSAVPADIAIKLRDYAMSIETGRIAASVAVGAPAIIEASRLADSTIVAAWLSESGQRFALDSREWRELADAGVPAHVRDAMDETVNPGAPTNARHFEGVGRWAKQASASWDQGTGQRVIFQKTPAYDPWGYGFGYDAWLFGAQYGYIHPFGFGAGDVFGLHGALGYLYGYRQSVTGYQRPNVLVLKDNAAGLSDGPAGPLPAKGEEANPKKTLGTAAVSPGGSTAGSKEGGPTVSQPKSGSWTVKP